MTKAAKVTAPPAEHNAATLAQGPAKKPSSAGEKVVVANKMPWPIRIRNCVPREVPITLKDGSKRTDTVFEPLPESIVVHGVGTPRGGARSGQRIFMGYALTEGVDKDSFDQWLKDNREQPFVKNQLIFAMPNVSDAEAKAKENEKRVTNFEAFDPAGDHRNAAPPGTIKTATNE